ncbi:hypothetical protein [Nafulsella turpanensis]|uniref:hypothetical protein n=1 Tax=Nafulsella turpanensis TaxID=1265690 RepID=UPI000349D3FC|nr:hypothetical protein [Nafulsella turpanensis]
MLQMVASLYGVESPAEADAIVKYYQGNRFMYGRNLLFHSKKVQLLQFRRIGTPLFKITGENNKVIYEQLGDTEGKEVLVDGIS